MDNNPYLKAEVQSMLTDPTKITKRNEEIQKTFELAKLTPEEQVLVMDKINGHKSLEVALGKLQPYIRA